MVSRRKLRQQTERNSQAAQSSLANFKPAAPATPSYPNLGTRIGQQPQGLSLSERNEMRTKLNNTNGKKMIQDTNAKFREQPSRFTGSFNNAFAAARKQGLKQFQWNGKLYGTQLATQQKAPTQIRRYTPSFRFPGVRSNEKGGKLEDKQKAFVAYLIQASGVDSEDELNDYIQDLGQEGLQKELEKFEELMTQGTEQVPAAAKGAKLNYIKSLRGQCPEGFEMQYFKKGGVMCSQCIKKAQAQKATKAEKGTKVVQDFKADMKKCGGKMKGKMKKKEDGGKVKTIPGVIDTKENKLSPKGKVQIKKHYFGGKL